MPTPRSVPKVPLRQCGGSATPSAPQKRHCWFLWSRLKITQARFGEHPWARRSGRTCCTQRRCYKLHHERWLSTLMSKKCLLDSWGLQIPVSELTRVCRKNRLEVVSQNCKLAGVMLCQGADLELLSLHLFNTQRKSETTRSDPNTQWEADTWRDGGHTEPAAPRGEGRVPSLVSLRAVPQLKAKSSAFTCVFEITFKL